MITRSLSEGGSKGGSRPIPGFEGYVVPEVRASANRVGSQKALACIRVVASYDTFDCIHEHLLKNVLEPVAKTVGAFSCDIRYDGQKGFVELVMDGYGSEHNATAINALKTAAGYFAPPKDKPDDLAAIAGASEPVLRNGALFG